MGRPVSLALVERGDVDILGYQASQVSLIQDKPIMSSALFINISIEGCSGKFLLFVKVILVHQDCQEKEALQDYRAQQDLLDP